jgi:hypothetical protein
MTLHVRVPLAAVIVALACCVCSVRVAGAQARQDEAALPRVAIEETPGTGAVAFPAGAIPIAVRVSGEATDRTIDDRLAAYGARKVPVWLAVPAPSSVDAVEPWRLAIQTLLARHRDAIVILEIESGDDVRLAGFATRLAATEVRSARDSIRVALGGTRVSRGDWLAELYTADLAPYVDVLTVAAGGNESAASAHLMKVDPDTRLAVLAGNEASARIVDRQLQTVGTNVAIVAWRSADQVMAALPALARIAPLLSGEITALDAPAARLTLSIAGRDVTDTTPHRLLFDNKTFATYLVYWGSASQASLDVSLTLPVEGEPAVYRLEDGSKMRAVEYSRNAETSRVRARVPIAGGPMLVDFNEGASAVFAERSDVSADRQLSVQEIIARHR